MDMGDSDGLSVAESMRNCGKACFMFFFYNNHKEKLLFWGILGMRRKYVGGSLIGKQG